MRRLYVEPERLRQPEIELRGGDARYLLSVLRLRAGDRVEVFDGEGCAAEAEIVAAGAGAASLRLDPAAVRRVEAEAEAAQITLICALLKAPRMDLVVQKATELGVARLRPVLCERSVPDGADGKAARWTRIAREAARQCGRADCPAVEAPARFSDVLGEPAPPRRILCHDRASPPIAAALAGGGEAVLAIGPEGGFSAAEVARAAAAGFRLASLGPRTLRAETAAIVACAAATILAPPPGTRYGSQA